MTARDLVESIEWPHAERRPGDSKMPHFSIRTLMVAIAASAIVLAAIDIDHRRR